MAHGVAHHHGTLAPAAACASVALDIGLGRGALILYPSERFRGREIEISRLGSDERRVHTGVHERRSDAGTVLTAVFGSLPAADYQVWPITPDDPVILGVPTYPSLADLPDAPDVVDVFRRPDQLPAVAEQAVAAGAGVLWIQLGLHSDEAVEIASSAGLNVVSNRCVKIEHARFHGGLHLAGFDTGVISSRRARG